MLSLRPGPTLSGFWVFSRPGKDQSDHDNSLQVTRLQSAWVLLSSLEYIQYVVILESVQRTFTNRIAGLQGTTHWNRLRTLKLMSLQMWNLLHPTSPNDIGAEFQDKNQNGLKAFVPKLNRISLLVCGTSSLNTWQNLQSLKTNWPTFCLQSKSLIHLPELKHAAGLRQG